MPEQRISVRVREGRFPGIKQRLERASIATGVRQSTLVLIAIDGVCSFIEQHGAVACPLPKDTLKRIVLNLKIKRGLMWLPFILMDCLSSLSC